MENTTIEELQIWLENNVKKYPEPVSLTLFDFSINWEKFSGSFKIMFDETRVPEIFTFSPEASGKPAFFMPLIHSPFGVPASYAALSISDKTRASIDKALKELIPRLLPFGKDQISGREVTHMTPIEERIVDYDLLKSAQLRLQSIKYKVNL